MEVLHEGGERRGRHVLMFIDATSPILASKKFRRLTTRARARRRLDTWLGSVLLMEDGFDTVVYWWVGSHLERKGGEGCYSVNAVADMLCGEVLAAGVGAEGLEVYPPSDPPKRRCVHRSITFGARRSDGGWAREVWQRHIVETHFTPVESGSTRPGGHIDLLHAKGVRGFDKRMILNARTGRIRLLHSRVDRPAEVKGSFAEHVRGVGCPCGKGRQDFRHLWRMCELPGVVRKREKVLECMLCVDDSSVHEQWTYTIGELDRPNRRPESLIDREIDESRVFDGDRGAGDEGGGDAGIF